MLSWKIADIAQAVRAKNDWTDFANKELTSVSFDSRTLEEGALFVPLAGEQDGHDYIENAIENGAQAAFWSRPLDQAPKDIAILQVDDSHQALIDFARAYLENIQPIVVAITGSNGKTTTKDMTASVLEQKYKTHKTKGNFNNNIGLPITILQMPRQTEVIVLEMGMNHAGEIHELSQLAQPDIAVITMVGESHIEFFQSRQGIADAKMEIIDGLKDQGKLIYNGDEPLLEKRANTLSQINKITFGQSKKNDLYPLNIESSDQQTTFQSNYQEGEDLSIPIPGRYNVNNALAALAVGLSLDLDYGQIKKGLSQFKLTANRLEWLEGPHSSRLLNDAYNASPSSMKASIQSFLSSPTEKANWLVLGDMGELGEKSPHYHLELKSVIDPQAVEYIILFGPQMKSLYQSIQKDSDFSKLTVRYFGGQQEELISYLRNHIQGPDRLLFKSSFSTDLITVVQALSKEMD